MNFWRRMLTFAVAILVIFSITTLIIPHSSSGRMRIATGYSLESLSLLSSDIAVYQAGQVLNTATEHEDWMHINIKAKRVKEIKGKPPKDYEIEFNYSKKYDFPAIRNASQILVFNPGRPSDEEGFWPYMVRLDGTRGGDSEWQPAITADFKILADADSIIDVVKHTLDMEKGGNGSPCSVVQVLEDAPESTEAFKELWSMSAVYVNTIMRPRHKQILLEIAEQDTGLSRAQAVQVLTHCFPETDTRQILENMLTDRGTVEWWTGDTLYPARQVAFEELEKRSISIKSPAGYRSEYAGAFTLNFFDSISLLYGLRAFSSSECYRQLENRQQFNFECPDSLLAMGAEGKVGLDLRVARDGSVRDVEVAAVEIETSPTGIAEALLKAAHRWRFKPVTVHGTPQKTTIVIPVKTEGVTGPLVLSKKRGPYFVGANAMAYDKPPRIVESGAAPKGWKLKVGGACEIETNVDSTGQVLGAKMTNSSRLVVEENSSGTKGSFEEAYLHAVRLWRFSPPKILGVSKQAVVRIPLEVNRTHFVIEEAAFFRFFPGTRQNPDGPLQLLEAPLPMDVNPGSNWSFSIVVKIDETGRVTDAYLPSRKLMRPLVEQMVSAARKLRFTSGDKQTPETCVVNISQQFQLPSYTYGEGLFPKE